MDNQTITSRLTVALKKPSILLILFSICFMYWFNDILRPYRIYKNETNFVWDAAGYYSYLPALFYFDGSFEFNIGYEGFLPFTADGNHYPKYTYGVALLQAPFYGMACLHAWLTGNSLNGFSSYFADFVRWGGLIYVLLGLLLLRKFLLHFFNEVVTTIALFCCLYGSMLFVYSFMQSEISHSYMFFLFCAFLYLTLKWHQQPRHLYSIGLAVVLGIISVVRVTDIYIALVFLLWDVRGTGDVKPRILFLFRHFGHLLWFPLFGVLFWIPQLLFWKHHLGTYFFDTYIDERFFWKDPQIVNVLLSYRKGWITYTPVVLLAFAGVFFVKKNFPVSRFTFLFIIALTLYVFSCWWDWNYGGCYGNRAFCQLIALLAVPIASVTEYVLYGPLKVRIKKASSYALLVFVFSCSFFTIGQAYQFQEQRVIHGYYMSKSIYWHLFRQFHYGPELMNPYWSMLHFRNEKAWRKGEERDDTKNSEGKK